jgi:hypothetical protein
MSPFQRRLFVAVDEWLGILLCLYLWRTNDPAFWWVFGTFVTMVYVISYPWLWWTEWKDQNKTTPPG